MLMKLYAVMSANRIMSVNEKDFSLPEGVYYIPVFSERKAAEEFSGGDFEILPLVVPEHGVETRGKA